MKIQLEGMDEIIEAKEVKDFISHLLALLAKPDASKMSMNAELKRTVIQVSKDLSYYWSIQRSLRVIREVAKYFPSCPW